MLPTLFGPSADAVFEKETATNHNIKTKNEQKSEEKGVNNNDNNAKHMFFFWAAAAGPGGCRPGFPGVGTPGLCVSARIKSYLCNVLCA